MCLTADYIYTHDRVYNFLAQYFLSELSDPYFRENSAAEIEENDRLAFSRYIAALLPYEPHYYQVVQYLCDKEGTINVSSLS